MSRIVPLCIFCRIRKSSCVRAITSTIALPMPSTSKRVATMEGAPSAQTAGTIAIGTASSVLFPQPCGLSGLAPHDEVVRDEFRELLGGAAQWLESLHPQLGPDTLRRKRRIGGDGELLDNWARGTCRGDETEPYFGREMRRRAYANRGIGQLARFAFCEFNQISHARHTERRMHREDQGQAGEGRDWRKILGEVEMQIGAGCRVREVRGGADVERVPVRRRASHKFRGKAAAGPGPTFDHHLLM